MRERLREMFQPGTPLLGSFRGEFAGTRDVGGEVVVLLRWDGDERMFGIPIDLTKTRQDFLYSGAVDDDDEWLESVGLGLMVMLDTGFRASARRRSAGDYIELRSEGGWPSDRRFYMQNEDPEPTRVSEMATVVSADGVEASSALAALREGRLAQWLLAYENNSTGVPWVGQATIVRVDRVTASISLSVLSGAPEFLRLDLAYKAAHSAVRLGFTTILLERVEPLFELAGFRTSVGGTMSLDPSFLDADPDGARAFLASDQTGGPDWGRDRDSTGRHLPDSRAARLLHRLRYGRSGRLPRIYVR